MLQLAAAQAKASAVCARVPPRREIRPFEFFDPAPLALVKPLILFSQ
jgi:hypothetical protein